MTNNWDKTSFILDGDFEEPGDEPEEGSYRDKLFNLLEEILGRIEKLEKNSHRHKMQNPEYREEWANFVKRVKEPRLTSEQISHFDLGNV